MYTVTKALGRIMEGDTSLTAQNTQEYVKMH